jgi:uncharacterized membrane protein
MPTTIPVDGSGGAGSRTSLHDVSQGPGAERSRGFERLATFVDAIVAIAITLLVLPLVDLATQLGDGSVLDLLRHHEAEIGAFFLSFVVIANAWLAQHRATRGVVAEDPVVVRLLVLWTLTIVFLPFPTALVAQRGHESATKVLYIGTMAATSAVLALIAWTIARTPLVRDTDDVPDPMRGVGATVGFLLALAVSLAIPRTSYYPLLVMLAPDPLIWLWRRRRRAIRPTP